MKYKAYATTYLKGKLMKGGAGWIRPENELTDLSKELTRLAKENWKLSKMTATVVGSKVIYTVVLENDETVLPEKTDNMPSAIE